MAEEENKTVKTRVRKTASVVNGDNYKGVNKLTDKEIQARKMRKYATTTFGLTAKNAGMGSGYSSGGVSDSAQGNFYSPQLSTDFLEKPQNQRERRAWYRNFYYSNEFVGRAIDLHTTLPLSKIRLEKPQCSNSEQSEYIYNFYVDMCNDIKLFKTLTEISFEKNLLGSCYIFHEDHEPYKLGDNQNEDKVRELKEAGKKESERLYSQFKILDRDPNYLGWRKLIILPPDQVRMKKIPLSDDLLIEFIPDPETRRSIVNSQDPSFYHQSPELEKVIPNIPTKLLEQLKENGSIPLDTDPYSGSHVYYLCGMKSQYETYGVSMLERCVNTLLLEDKLRQAQTSIATRHMTPIRVVWAEELSEQDVEDLREQVDLALVDPDFSIITNYQVNWQEMGSNGRLLELAGEYEHIENTLFAGLGVTREILTGEGTYSGNRITLEIMNTQYLLFREIVQEYVENNIFKPVAKKKGFIEKDKYGKERLIYPKLSFSRLAIRDNDAFFEQAMQLYNKGSLSIDVILEMMNIDPLSTRKKIEADLFTVNDFAFNQLMTNLYVASATKLVEGYDTTDKIAEYLDLKAVAPPADAAVDALGGGVPMGGMPDAGGARFAASNAKTLSPSRKAALSKLVEAAMKDPVKLDKIVAYLSKK